MGAGHGRAVHFTPSLSFIFIISPLSDLLAGSLARCGKARIHVFHLKLLVSALPVLVSSPPCRLKKKKSLDDDQTRSHWSPFFFMMCVHSAHPMTLVGKGAAAHFKRELLINVTDVVEFQPLWFPIASQDQYSFHMSGQEPGILHQAASDGANTEPESSEFLNGITTKFKALDQALLHGTTTQPEIVMEAASNGTTTQPEIVEKAASSGTTTRPEIVEEAASSGTTTQSEIVEEAASSGTTTQSEIVEEAASSGPTTKSERRSKSSRRNRPVPPRGPDYNTEWLDLSRSIIADKDTKIYAMALERNLLPNLKVLFLEGNAGAIGIKAAINALRAGHVKGLTKLVLWEVSSYDKITPYEKGTDMIAAALKAGNLPKLNTMDLTGSLPKLISARSKSKTVIELLFACSWGTGRFLEGRDICIGCLNPFCKNDPKKNQALECLRCLARRLHYYSGDDGISKIAGALATTPIYSLRLLILQQNYIGDRGATSLAEILQQNKLPNLDELDLRHNPVGKLGAKNIVLAYLKNPLLTVRVKLDWPNFELQGKCFAFRDSNIKLELRLEDLEICAEDIVKGEHYELEQYASPDPEFRLHLQCQANCASYGSGGQFLPHEFPPVDGQRGINTSTPSLSQRYVQIDSEKNVVEAALDRRNRADIFYLRNSNRFLRRSKISRKVRDKIEELLVLGDSNPDVFYYMFGLRQVLLQNPPPSKNKDLYSRVWVCKSCFEDYDQKRPKVVQPITTDGELEPSLDQSPKPESEGTKSHWRFQSFLTQLKGFCRGQSPPTT